MFIQLLVENAIKHGLKTKEGKKLLTVDIAKDGAGYTSITVTDNGAGFDITRMDDNSTGTGAQRDTPDHPHLQCAQRPQDEILYQQPQWQPRDRMHRRAADT